ncbi:MAG TPA: hypothetical protein VG889_08335 [Rhizomicrobium sp.]|nr:hypothetical protein [Rhizomicrobium sp.]
METWSRSSHPLLLRDSRRRGETATGTTGRSIAFADNTPANWSFGLALAGQVPDISGWTKDNFSQNVPLTFLTKGQAAKRDLNRRGWKICHIDPVSDRERYKVEEAPFPKLEAEFLRFISPRNIFIIPKSISGAGELPEVIESVKAFELSHRKRNCGKVRSPQAATIST